MDRELIIYGCGDIMPYGDNPSSHFKEVAPIFNADNAIAFANLEAVLSNGGSPAAQCLLPTSADPCLAKVIKDSGFDIVSFASNHALDYGREAFYETLQHLEDAELQYIGAGRNEDEANKIVIIEKENTKVAFVGFCSILPQDYWALEARPGVNPARGLVASVAVEHDQPGTPQRIYTFPHPEDLERLIKDVEKARSMADIVIVSMHWGIHRKRAVLADYQRYYAHFAIDAGADLILGHHAHVIKPIEVYKGKAIFYSLGNFAMKDGFNPRDLATCGMDHMKSKRHKEVSAIAKVEKEPGRFHPVDAYYHTIAKCVVRNKRISSVSFIPAYLRKDDVTYIPDPNDYYWTRITEEMRDITNEVGLKTEFNTVGNEVHLVL